MEMEWRAYAHRRDHLHGGVHLMTTAYTPSAAVSSSFAITDAFALTIAANTSDYNVYAAFVSAHGVPPANVALVVTVNAAVVVSATSTVTAALTWGNSWTGTPTFSLINNGSILGAGGSGGVAATSLNGGAGGAGGKAMELSGQTVSITNAS